MKQLTNHQISQLFDFTKKHYVEYYDVQIELVDHLAAGIEKIWEENPDLSFDEALNTEFKKFGIFGFTDLVEKKKSALINHYAKLIWKEILAFFSFPKIVFSAILFVLLFYIYKTAKPWMVTMDYLPLMVFALITTVCFIFFKNKIKTKNKWLLQSISNYLLGFPLFLIFQLLYGLMISENMSLFKILLKTTITEIFILYLVVLYTQIATRLVNEIKKTEAKFKFI